MKGYLKALIICLILVLGVLLITGIACFLLNTAVCLVVGTGLIHDPDTIRLICFFVLLVIGGTILFGREL